MPAARRFKQSEIDSIRKGINALPNGTPPEPEFDKGNALWVLEPDIRRRYEEDHVSIADIVKKLNEAGFNTSFRKISGMLSGKSKRGKVSVKTKKPAAPRKDAGTIKAKTDRKADDGSGTFEIRKDDEDC